MEKREAVIEARDGVKIYYDVYERASSAGGDVSLLFLVSAAWVLAEMSVLLADKN